MSEVPSYQPEEAENFQETLGRQSEANMAEELNPPKPDLGPWSDEAVDEFTASAAKNLEVAESDRDAAIQALENQGLEPTRRTHLELLKATAEKRIEYWQAKISEYNQRHAA